MRTRPPFELPPDYQIDVDAAYQSVAKLAEAEPDTPLLLTIAQVTGDGGLEEEREVRMRAEEAAALLSTIEADQRVPGLSRELYLLRVTRPPDL